MAAFDQSAHLARKMRARLIDDRDPDLTRRHQHALIIWWLYTNGKDDPVRAALMKAYVDLLVDEDEIRGIDDLRETFELLRADQDDRTGKDEASASKHALDISAKYARKRVAIAIFVRRAVGTLVPATSANFDEDAYLAANPDVKASLDENGIFTCGLDHFTRCGSQEGRRIRIFEPRRTEILVRSMRDFGLRFSMGRMIKN